MKQWFGPLSLRYKLTFSALAVEALMFAFLIGSGMQSTSLALQKQAEQRVQEIAKTLAVALQAPLSQRDDASIRDIIEVAAWQWPEHDRGARQRAAHRAPGWRRRQRNRFPRDAPD